MFFVLPSSVCYCSPNDAGAFNNHNRNWETYTKLTRHRQTGPHSQIGLCLSSQLARQAVVSCSSLRCSNVSCSSVSHSSVFCSNVRSPSVSCSHVRSSNASWSNVRYFSVGCFNMVCFTVRCSNVICSNVSRSNRNRDPAQNGGPGQGGEAQDSPKNHKKLFSPNGVTAVPKKLRFRIVLIDFVSVWSFPYRRVWPGYRNYI